MALHLGFLGAGFIARYHRTMLQASGADVQIAAVYDIEVERAERFSSETGAAVVGDETAVIEASDAVYVCTWTSEHRRCVEAVAAAGKAVFCEKPLAPNLADALEMVQAVESAGVTNQVGLVLRDSPAFCWVRHLVQRPEAGRLMTVVFRDDQYIPIQGVYESSWRADQARAGSGTLLEHSIHDLDLLEWLFGPVCEVSARTGEFHDIEGIEDLAVVTLVFEGGAVGTLTSVWHDILGRPSQRRMEVFCERAHVVLEGDVFGPVHWTFMGPDGETAERGSAENHELFARCAEAGFKPRNPDGAFIEAVLAGRPASPDCAAALRPHLLAEVAYRSAAAGGATLSVPPGRPAAP
ncbi:MAG: Gfo/Idh/MocA family oxidoreductase [Acidimicrobiales bacterium]|nr:Gfo/Idh/MocA family oxidoreductase [Acidimicrobiales bacterium]